MIINTVNWRDKLQTWLQHNTKTIPDDLWQLREEFVRRFPKEKLGEMTLGEYAVGKGDNDSFSYWLEYKTKNLGRIGGGSAKKTGVWWSKSEDAWHWNHDLYRSPDEAHLRIRDGLVRLIKATEQGRLDELDKIGEEHFGQVRYLRAKPLYLYFPTQFLPMTQLEHIAHFLKAFGVEPHGEVVERNLQLLALLRGFKEFEGFDTLQMMQFIYDTFPPAAKKDVGGKTEPPEPPSPPFNSVPRELVELMDTTARTRNVLLYGPPGTGKTYWVRRFTESFLRLQITGLNDTKQSLSAVLQELKLKWYEAIALVMTLAEGQKSFSVPELMASELLREYISLTNAATPKNTVHEQLQRHTSPSNPNVNVSNSKEPFLFDKNDQSEWRLSPEGKKYVEAHLNEKLSKLRNQKTGLSSDEEYYEFVTFHQSFAYEEFVEGLRPVTVEETDEETGDLRTEIQYRVMPGVFRRICARAEAAWRTHGKDAPKYLLVIDEINRANIAKVLGELITLIEDDKRLGEENEVTVTLPSSGERFGVPPNLYILGTMNTADRSIALLDLALRRRFTFVEMKPNVTTLDNAEVDGVNLGALLTRINERILLLLDQDHLIGHSYFLNVKDADELRFRWYKRVVPLLQEYFYNDYEHLKAVIGGKFVHPVKISKRTQSALGELVESAQPPHEIASLEMDEFLVALRELAGAGVEEVQGMENVEEE